VNIKALIFDVDGTLADTEEAHRTSFNQAFEQHGLDWHWSRADYAHWLETTGGKERIRAYIDSLELPPVERQVLTESVPALHRSKTDIYARLIREGRVPLRDGVARLLDEAETAGVRLAIATTTSRENIDALLSVTLGEGALERFSVIGAGDEVRRKKPAPDIYDLVLGRLGESAAQCVAIEDSLHGLTAAKAAGLFTVVTPSQWTRGEDFSAADLLLTSLGTSDRPLMELEHAFGVIRKWSRRPKTTAAGEA
jgi:HAD superfamily hydrolase (TIGR01509 family)